MVRLVREVIVDRQVRVEVGKGGKTGKSGKIGKVGEAALKQVKEAMQGRLVTRYISQYPHTIGRYQGLHGCTCGQGATDS